MRSAARDALCVDDAGTPEGWSLSRYARECSTAVDVAAAEWPISRTVGRTGDTVRVGYAAGSSHLSVMWTHVFPARRAAVSILAAIKAMCVGANLAAHAPAWDSTFDGAEILGKLASSRCKPPREGDSSDDGGSGDDDDALVVRWHFNAPPLAKRELLYAIATRREKETAQTTYAYASVTDAWASIALRRAVPQANVTTAVQPQKKRVRCWNNFPSCDRVTVLPDGAVLLEHMITTRIGGWIPRACFNVIFRSALIDASVHECAAFAQYAEELAERAETYRAKTGSYPVM